MDIQFFGAAKEVTGSKHLITTKSGKKILLDCGMFQGKGLETDAMNRNLGFNAREIDHVILSHAHIDHSGLIPYLYKKGFRGSVICTPATRDLCALMLLDSAHIQELDAKYFNKKQERHHQYQMTSPIYTAEHAQKCLSLFISVAYDRRFYIDNNISVKFFNSGHMLGGAIVCLDIKENGHKTRITYTGDIGRPNNHILCPPQPFLQTDYLICESTYGNRLHPEQKSAEEELLEIVTDTCIRRKGKLIIPSFSIGRTQEIVYVLNSLYNEGRLPKIPIYVDSPLSVNATEVFRLYTDDMNENVRELMHTDPDPFGFNTLHYVSRASESKRLNNSQEPAIIISASGMLEAGRVKHHVANHIEDPSTTILIVGYCTPSSLGARIQEPGLKEISIFGIVHPVRAQIKKIEGFSGHGDYKEMIDYIRENQDPDRVAQVIIVHGEENAQLEYKQHLEDAGFKNIVIPSKGEKIELPNPNAV